MRTTTTTGTRNNEIQPVESSNLRNKIVKIIVRQVNAKR